MLTPYPIITTDKGYRFITTHQIYYEAYFTDITQTFPLVSIRVLSFGFDCAHVPEDCTITSLPVDNRVGETIATILDQFFTHNRDVLIYVPMDTDQKAMQRSRLFDMWWQRFKPHLNCQVVERDRYIFTYPGDEFVATLLYRTEVKAEIQIILSGLDSHQDENK